MSDIHRKLWQWARIDDQEPLIDILLESLISSKMVRHKYLKSLTSSFKPYRLKALSERWLVRSTHNYIGFRKWGRFRTISNWWVVTYRKLGKTSKQTNIVIIDLAEKNVLGLLAEIAVVCEFEEWWSCELLRKTDGRSKGNQTQHKRTNKNTGH